MRQGAAGQTTQNMQGLGRGSLGLLLPPSVSQRNQAAQPGVFTFGMAVVPLLELSYDLHAAPVEDDDTRLGREALIHAIST